jgi:hypothetical protein
LRHRACSARSTSRPTCPQRSHSNSIAGSSASP